MVEDKKINTNIIQNIFLENREKLNVSGVKDENIRINKLSIDTSEVSIDGTINNLNYSNTEPGGKKSSSLLGKIFK